LISKINLIGIRFVPTFWPFSVTIENNRNKLFKYQQTKYVKA